MYNFYFFLILSTLIFPFCVFLRKNILQSITVVEEILISQVIIFIFFILFYVFVEKGKFSSFLKKLTTNKNGIFGKLIIYDVLISVSIVLSGYILIKQKVIYGESMKTAFQLILIALISCLYKNIMNWKFIIGLIFIITGIFFLESGNKLEL